MKKGWALLLLVLVLLLSACGGHVKGQADTYGEEDGWTYAYCEKWDHCVVTAWQWDGNEDNMTVTIPETLGGRTVTGLSQKDTILGHFEVKLPEELDAGIDGMTCDADYVAAVDDHDYDTYVFRVVLNENIEYVDCPDTWYLIGEDNVQYKLEYVFD